MKLGYVHRADTAQSAVPPPATEEATAQDRSSDELHLSTAADEPYETLGRTTGVTAVVLTADSLEFIDLDTAQSRTFPLEHPVAADTIAVGNRLLVLEKTLLVPSGPTAWSIELATGRTTDIGAGDRVAPALDPGRAWVWSSQSARWRQIDETGGVVQQLEWPQGAVPWDHGAGTPELASAPGGGIYRFDGGWSQVSECVPVFVY